MTNPTQPMEHYVSQLEEQLTHLSGRIDARRRRRRTLQAAGATAVLAGTLALADVGVGPDDGPVPAYLGAAQAAAAERCRIPSEAGPTVRSCLTALGTVAADWTAPGEGSVAYEQRWSVGATRYVGPIGRPGASSRAGGYAVVFPVTVDTWVAPDGAGQTTRNPAGSPILPTRADRRKWRAAGSPSLGSPPPAGSVGAYGDGLTTTADGRIIERWGSGEAQSHLLEVGEQGEDGGPQLFEGRDAVEALPNDPGRLLSTLRRLAWRQRVVISGDPCPNGFGRCPAPTEAAVANNVGTLATGFLAYPATPRPLRSALLRSLGELRGAKTLGRSRDPLGRPGTIVRLPKGYNNGNDLLLFDTKTARLLAQGSARSHGTADPFWGTLYAVKQARVESVGRIPAPNASEQESQ